MEDKKIKTEIEELVCNYLSEGQMARDFMNLKPTERARFLEKVLPYFISSPKKGKTKGEKTSGTLSLFKQAGITLK